MNRLIFQIILALLCVKGLSQGVTSDTVNYLSSQNWDDNSLWNLSQNSDVTAAKANFNGLHGNGIAVTYTFPTQGDWFDLNIPLPDTFQSTNSIAFFVKSSNTSNNLELKFTDTDGSTFRRVVPMSRFSNWEHVVIYLDDMQYAWGGNSTFDQFSSFSIAASGIGSGTLWIDEAGIGKDTLKSTFSPVYDPDSTLAGIGFLQRRDSFMKPEDTLVLKYLEVLQDISSTNMALLPSQEDNTAQTFNNAMAAIAFIVKNQKERAERILDFYAQATDTNNTDINKQNFYYKLNGISQARGFYQECDINTLTATGSRNRWIGDMAWLLIVCKNYELKYNSTRYENLVKIIKNLLLSFYLDSGQGGYVQEGWKNGDSYFSNAGYHEGNIDCYVALKLCGDNYHAQKIKIWVQDQLKNTQNLPLDLYTWRVLAFGKDYIQLLNIPEYNYSYRKIIKIDGTDVMGLYSNPDLSVDNFWNDGTGHMSCVCQAFGDVTRGYFYANQMDHLIITRIFGSDTTHTIPYTVNRTGGYDWVDTTKGFTSSAAWYILAKNGYNPFLSAGFKDTVISSLSKVITQSSFNVFPNPFSSCITIRYNIPVSDYLNIEIYDIKGRKIISLVDRNAIAGKNSVTWNGENSMQEKVSPGVYLIRLISGDHSETRRIVYLK